MKRIYTLCIGIVLTLCAVLIPVSANISESVPVYADSETVYTIEDIKNLQNFLLVRETPDLSGKDYDLNDDNRWDVFDLCLMKQQFVKQSQAKSDTLIAYFSCTGNTETVASYLKEETGGNIFEIVPSVPYTADDLNYSNSSCRANQEQNDPDARPEIAQLPESMEQYDVIYIGFPIWWGEEPRIIDTFLESFDYSEKIIIPFCTSGSSSITSAVRNIQTMLPDSDVLDGRRFGSSTSKEEVKTWLDLLDIPEKVVDTKMNISVNGHIMTATLERNSSIDALVKLLESGPITIDMGDYANFEKVGKLPQQLPRNDEQLDTDYGDLILYLGKQFVIYYDKNSWNFTKLGHIDNVTQEELKNILGGGNVTVELSLDNL